MPKLIKDKVKERIEAGTICAACEGSGRSSKGGSCHPCGGTGRPWTWVCPACKTPHHGFMNQRCRNRKCKRFGA